MATNAESRAPLESEKAPSDVKFWAVASCVMNDEPLAIVPVNTPLLTVPVAVDELLVPDEVPPDVLPPADVLPDDVLPEPVPPELAPPLPADVLPVLELPLPELVPELNEAIVPQSSLVASSWPARYTFSDGLVSVLVTPNGARPGPTARIKTRRGAVPAMTNPTVAEPPVPTIPREETLAIGADDGIAARLNVPVVVLLPDVVV